MSSPIGEPAAVDLELVGSEHAGVVETLAGAVVEVVDVGVAVREHDAVVPVARAVHQSSTSRSRSRSLSSS